MCAWMGIQQDCLYIEQGHLMPPTTFMTYSMAVDPRQISGGNMDSYKDVFYATGLPALISTGITLVYLLLKRPTSLPYMLYPTKPKGGWQRPCQVVVNASHGSIAGEEGDQQVHEQVPRSFSNQYGAGNPTTLRVRFSIKKTERHMHRCPQKC